MPQKFNHF